MKPLESGRVPIAASAAAIVAIAAFVLWRSGTDDAVPAPPPAPPPVQTAAPAPIAPSAPPPTAVGLRLHGLLGRGAIIALPDGQQRFFAIGREVTPGLRVDRIEPQGVVLASADGEVRLGFDGAGPSQSGPQTQAAAGSDQALRDETLRYRLGLAPRQAGARNAGFVVRPGASMPSLERAGLRPGDVILSVNGSRFDEERMLELAWEIANAERTEFEVERGGRRIRLALQD